MESSPSRLVRGFERLGDLPRDGQRFVDRNRPTRDPRAQILAFDQFHHQRPRRAAVFDAVDLGDVWVIERRQGACFSLEARATIGVIRGVRGQKLDGDLTTQPLVAGAIDFPIPPEPIGARTV